MILSIIIVNYNTCDLLKKCVDSINKFPPACEYEIIVVDNASSDGSDVYVDEIGGTLLDKNLGFSAANNIGIKKSRGNYILLLNPDTTVLQGTLDKCLNKLKSSDDIGILGCRVLLENGELDLACRRGFPTLWNSFCKFSGLSRLFPKLSLFSGYNLTHLSEFASYEVDAVVGAFMLFRRELINKIGYLDESFFMYGEDIDFCYRCKSAGEKVFYFSEAVINHHKRASSVKSKKAKYEFYNSMKIYYGKYHKNPVGRFFVNLFIDILCFIKK